MAEMFPTGITANRETSELIIDWKDGHTSRIPFSILRNACPCAECRGGHDKMGSTHLQKFLQWNWKIRRQNTFKQH